MWLTIILTAIATLVVVIIVQNLSSLERHLEHQINPSFSVDDEEFVRTVSTLFGPALPSGNKVECLVNGCRFFPAMLQDIKSAQNSITLETFIFWSGDIGHQFTEALIERAHAGVRVHVLVDWLGSWHMDSALVEKLKNSEIQFRRFRPLRWHDLAVFNNRTHRKILVVDGKVAYTGGVGIADTWNGDAENTGLWRDNQYRLEGPAVAGMQTAFLDNWVQVEAELLLGNSYFPRLEEVGNLRAQSILSGPGNGSDSARIMFLLSIACARRSVCLGQGYFVPDNLSRKILIAAAKKGVKVEVIIQGPTDAPYTQAATRFLLGELLQAGIDIYEYQQARYHCKLLIVDDLWVSVGSTNFDARSFRLNDEVNLNVYDAEFAREEAARFNDDKAKSRKVTYEDWKARPLRQKAIDATASLFRKQL